MTTKDLPIGNYFLLVSSILAFLTSVACLIKVYTLSKMNRIIKILLFTMGIINCIDLMICLVTNLVSIGFQINFLINCSIILNSTAYLLETNLVMMAVISVIRYWIAYKISKHKIVPEKYLILLIAAGALIPLGLLISKLLFMSNFGYAKSIYFCADLEPLNNDILPFQRIISVFTDFSGVIVAIVFDIKMYLLVKNTHKPKVLTENQVIPWKSTNHKEAEDLKVPLKATVVNSGQFTCLILLLPVIVLTGLYYFWAWQSIMIFLSSSSLPLTLHFCIKKQNKIAQIVRAQPPVDLQFHDEELNNPDPGMEMIELDPKNLQDDMNPNLNDKKSERL